LEIGIDTEGRVDTVVVRRSIPELDQAAINAVRQWRFVPARIGGVPTPVTVMVSVDFSLRSPEEARDHSRQRYEQLLLEMRALEASPDVDEARRLALESERASLVQQMTRALEDTERR